MTRRGATVLLCALAWCMPDRATAEAPAPPTPAPAPSPGPHPVPHPTSCNLHVGDAFDGTYVCGQGQTGVRLEVLEVHGHDVRAAFDFHFDPRGITGRFVLHGTCEGATHRWAMQPERWERQPPGWIMVGMDGTLSADSRQYTGRMTYSACGDFVVARP